MKEEESNKMVKWKKKKKSVRYIYNNIYNNSINAVMILLLQ